MKIRHFTLFAFLAAFTLAALGATALAQTSRGTVSGTVADPNGAVIAGADVTLTNTQTTVARSTTTNDEGFYRFDAVDLGTYSVSIKGTGFGEVVKTNVIVNANQTSTVDAQLQLGVEQIVVDVTADAGAVLQTEAPVRGGNISTQQVTELPIASRNPVSLALTLPGVSSNRNGFGIGTFSVNGARGRSNNFLLDGIENNDISVAGQGFQITNPDAVQEVSVQTSNYDAEFGRAGGAVVNTITKSGTNEFHGTLAAFLDATRDDAITSSLSRIPRIAARGRLDPGTQQIYSGTFGGPLYLPRFGEGGPAVISGKNRTFFFVAYQEERQTSQATVQLTAPTAAGRARLRELFPAGTNPRVDTLLGVTQNAVANTNIFNVALGRPSNAAGTPIAGAADRGNIEFGTFGRSLPDTFRDRQFQLRIDHRISDSDQLTGRYVFGDNVDPEGGDVTFEGFEAASNNRVQNLLLNEVHVFSPTLTNDLRLGYSRIEFNFPITGDSALANTLQQIQFQAGSRTPRLGVASNLPQGRIANNYIFQDTMTYVSGNHTFRFGTELLEQRSKQSAPFNSRGTLVYNSSTIGSGASAIAYSGLANFVDDFGGGGGAAIDFGSPVYYPILFRQAYFFQDRWQVNTELTLTLGVRYENFGQPVNTLNTAAFTGLFNIDPVTRTGPFSRPNDAEDDNNNFAPTFGFAYSPTFNDGLMGAFFGDRRTVIRGGYQIGYDSFFNNIASNAASSSPNVIATSAPNVTVIAARPRGRASLSGSLPTTARPVDPLDSQTLVARNLRNPYYQRWSFGVQRELPFNFIAEASYVGSKGTKLFLSEQYNPPVPAALQVTPAGYTGATSGRLDNLQGSRLIRTNGGSSIYHSGQFSLNRRFTNGLTFTANYTWSKLIDNGSEVFQVAALFQPQEFGRPAVLGFSERLERGLSFFDRTHRGVVTYVYELPLFREQRGFAGHVLGGWEVSGVTTYESGVPYTVQNGVNADAIGLVSTDRPDVNPAGQRGVRAIPATATSPSPTGFVNPDVIIGQTASGANIFAPIDPASAYFIGIPAGAGRTGGLGRNTERSPGTKLWNVNITKRTRISENVRVEFRTEFFNIFNVPNYTQGSISPFTPTGGSIPSDVFNTAPGEFLNPNTALSDGGGRVIRYQLKFVF